VQWLENHTLLTNFFVLCIEAIAMAGTDSDTTQADDISGNDTLHNFL